MKNLLFYLFIAITVSAQVNFDDYFEDKTLRFDYFHTGKYKEEVFSFDEMVEEPIWAGSKKNLIDNLNYGHYFAKVFDSKTNKLIFSKGYSTLFNEYVVTEEGAKVVKTLGETIRFPFPKNKVRLEIYSRDWNNVFCKKFEYEIDPKNYFIKKQIKVKRNSFKVHYSNTPDKCLDIVFLPEGFSNEEKEQFHKECKRFAKYLLNNKPFKQFENKINIWGVDVYSEESGVDIPKENVWKRSALDFSYYTFNSERYLMTTNNKAIRNLAANAPYDQIYVLINSKKYGGGAIYNFYSCCITGNPQAEKVFLHEFGHGLAGLADEYFYDGAYNPFYNLKVEPWEANITTLVNFESKWKDLVPKGVPIPTPDSLNTIGAFEGGGYTEKGIYRATKNSLMRTLENQEFNEVSKRAIIKVIKQFTD